MSDLSPDPFSCLQKELSRLEQPDALGVLSSTREVVRQARLVQIEPARIEALARLLAAHAGEAAGSAAPAWPAQYHFFDGTERTVNWVLLLDALNFCFWGEKDQPRWQIEYRGEILNGYWAEAASLRRAVEEGRPVWDAEYLSKIDQEELAAVFRGNSPAGPDIPLFEERLRNAREVGQVLLARFEGQFSHLVEQVQQSGVELVLALVEHFPSFRDVATYDGQEVRFFKRAQICVADLHSAFSGQAWGAFTDLDQLTIFADYKLPQVLRHHGVLVYAPELAARVDHQEQLSPGSAEEVEIRAATVWASELLRRAVARQREQAVTAAEIDQLLWNLGQEAGAMRPYHRVRTLFY
ncbi:MAG TPA: queuosine salvage family protein [Ktedonobacteraceae bacterium]|nr:queuosine salvage family protein [Ktedonobacteraceae bacterium]